EQLTLSVNIAPAQLRDRSLTSQIFSAADQTGFPLRQLMVEITETALGENIEIAIKIAEDLKTLKVKLALDDFGTGYSNLRQLNLFFQQVCPELDERVPRSSC